MNVLIIDDDEVNNFLCKKVIEKTGFSNKIQACTKVENAISYLKQAYKNKSTYPDILFLDINMPIENGWDFLDRFQQLINDNILSPVKTYMLSSSLQEDDINKATEHPLVERYLTKPLDADWLISLKNSIREN